MDIKNLPPYISTADCLYYGVLNITYSVLSQQWIISYNFINDNHTLLYHVSSNIDKAINEMINTLKQRNFIKDEKVNI